MLEIIVSKPMPMAGVDFSNYQEMIDKAIKEDNTLIVVSYLHGELEEKMGYDIGLCLNGQQCADVEKGLYKEGIYDAKVIDYPNPCKAFLWNARNCPKALIVDANNAEDCAYAEKCYNNKGSRL